MNTRDLSEFGIIELNEVGKLLSALKTNNDKTHYLYDDITVEFNPNSGNVFLVDNDCNVAMMTSDDTLEDFFVLGYEGHEGFLDDLIVMYQNGEIEHEDDIEQLQEIAKECGTEFNLTGE